MQDTDPLPWGALDRYQAHFIVRKDPGSSPGQYVARTRLETGGRFGAKTVKGVRWDGPGGLALRLNGDAELSAMIAKQSYHDATIFVEPTDGMIRIRGKWANHLEFGITRDLFEIYDRIAGHIRAV